MNNKSLHRTFMYMEMVIPPPSKKNANKNKLQWIGLHHHLCDDDGLFKGRLLPPSHSRYIFASAFLSIASGIYALYKGYFDLSLVPFGVFVTSVNYWRDPTLSWRRNMDIGYVLSSILYQSIRAAWAEYGTYYYIATYMGIGCAVASWIVFRTHTGMSTAFHVLAHILGNVGCIALYKGYV